MAGQTFDLHVNPSAETIRVGPLVVRFLLTGENSTGSIAAFEVLVPRAQRLPAPAHSHDHYEETIYGIDGVLTWTVDGKKIDTPAAIGPDYFRETAEVLNAAAGGPADRAKMAEIMRRHGLTPAPPRA